MQWVSIFQSLGCNSLQSQWENHTDLQYTMNRKLLATIQLSLHFSWLIKNPLPLKRSPNPYDTDKWTTDIMTHIKSSTNEGKMWFTNRHKADASLRGEPQMRAWLELELEPGWSLVGVGVGASDASLRCEPKMRATDARQRCETQMWAQDASQKCEPQLRTRNVSLTCEPQMWATDESQRASCPETPRCPESIHSEPHNTYRTQIMYQKWPLSRQLTPQINSKQNKG